MNNSRIEDVVDSYEVALTVLKNAGTHPSEEEVLYVLNARDEVHKALNDKTQESTGAEFDARVKALNLPSSMQKIFGSSYLIFGFSPRTRLLKRIQELDSDLKKQAKHIAHVNIADSRASLNPPAEAWWWFMKPKSDVFLDRFLDVLFFLLLIFALILGVKILTLFFGGRPNILNVLPIVLSIISIPWIAVKWNLGRRNFRFFVAALLFVLVIQLALPQYCLKRGEENYKAGHLGSAEFNFKVVLTIHPNNVKAHHYLGLVYEKLLDFKSARTEYQYQIAVKSNVKESAEDKNIRAASYNNLARLYILEENYATAASLLNQLKNNKTLKPELGAKEKYFLYKNLGWVRLEQKHLDAAKWQLKKAIRYAKLYQDKLTSKKEQDLARQQKASGHCLLAQVLEQQCNTQQAREEWENCRQYASPEKPEEDEWIFMAQERERGKIPQVEGCES
ncbi:MAG: hypothetical protein QNJ72_36695 [Pleurocapsa sp. MO_226.B13]|nr:hypothetical protein [Pleurocapsa sp. MO_226.B13]